MDRARLQQLADLRLQDAVVLLDAGRWEAAYYLLGYCVECGLKACVAKQFREHEVPEKALVNSFYTHRIDELLRISGLRSPMKKQANIDSGFGSNWNTVQDWNEAVRYEVSITEATAREMYEAVTNIKSGVLPWLKLQW